MIRQDGDDMRWSSGGAVMAWALASETVMAVVAITHPDLLSTRVLVMATALAAGSSMLAARARMPVQIKAGLNAAVYAALLALAAVLDPFGLRAIDRRIDTATMGGAPAAPQAEEGAPVVQAAGPSQVGLQGRGSTAAAAFANDLAQSIAARTRGEGGEFRVEGIVDIATDAAGDTYRLTWSLARQADLLWCGRIVAVGQTRDAVIASFGTTIASAMRRSRGGPMTCQ